MDTDRFPCYVDYIRRSPEMLIVHANIINNGVAAYYQVHSSRRLLEKFPALAEYPEEVWHLKKGNWTEHGFKGQLWESGAMAREMHQIFLSRPELFSTEGPRGE